MGNAIDFLFKACCLGGLIFGVTRSIFYRILKPRLSRSGDNGLNRVPDWAWHVSVIRKEYLSLEDRRLVTLFSFYRFCVLGAITCMALAITLIFLSILLRVVFPLIVR
jgi:hypothetical protein